MPVATAALPGVPAGFTGRDEDLARLMPVLDPSAGSDLPVVICAVSGLGGIGKTALALYAAHRAVAEGWFPGGTLFVDFRGGSVPGTTKARPSGPSLALMRPPAIPSKPGRPGSTPPKPSLVPTPPKKPPKPNPPQTH